MEIHTEKLLHRLAFVAHLCKGSKENENHAVVVGKNSSVANFLWEKGVRL